MVEDGGSDRGRVVVVVVMRNEGKYISTSRVIYR